MVASLAAEPSGQLLPLTAAQAHYLRDVLRLRPGDEMVLFDQEGWTVSARLAAAPGPQMAATLMAAPAKVPHPGALTVAVPAPRGERADWLVEKLTELGVAHIVWIETEHTQPHSRRGRPERWARIAGAAAGQARVPAPPSLGPARPLQRWLAERANNGPLFVADAAGAPPPPRSAGPPAPVAVVVGPEGGLSDAEQGQLVAAGGVPLRLAAHVLRVETAAVAAAAILQA